jgi:hypothetical protein
MDFTRIGLIFSGHGFGFNTNILETNVINLAVVIAVVVSVVGDAVRELLKIEKKQLLIIYVKLIISITKKNEI